jgi:(1->4)-alpha-D-glucan 1-alpha-D-glucosylmutase
VLNLRRQDPELFQRGSYLPLTLMGPAADHVCTFARLWEGRAVVVLAPRLLHTLCAGDATRLTSALWAGTQLQAEAALPAGPWRDLLTGELWPALSEGDLTGVFTQVPLALLVSGG